MTDPAASRIEAFERRLDALERTVADIEETVSMATDRDIPLLIGAGRALVDADIEGVEELPEARWSFHQR